MCCLPLKCINRYKDEEKFQLKQKRKKNGYKLSKNSRFITPGNYSGKTVAIILHDLKDLSSLFLSRFFEPKMKEKSSKKEKIVRRDRINARTGGRSREDLFR